MTTLSTVTTVGAVLCLQMSTVLVTDLHALLTWRTLHTVWTSPALLAIGLKLSIPTVLILLCHELGHYAACRFYGYPVSPPYFLPAPFALGTVGAFIRIGSPVRNKRELFDIGAAGPLAGFVALLPFLVWGISASRVVPFPQAPPGLLGMSLLVPGHSLAMRLVTWAVHGPLPEGYVLDLHPFALAAWVGLLATALNLLPLGQLDGGHILYALFGRRHHRLAVVLWVGLLALSLLWLGWVLWCLVILALGLRHPPVIDEAPPVGARRTALGTVLLLVFLLSFAPVPVELLPLGG